MDDLDMYELQAKQASGRNSTTSKSCAWSCLKRSTPGHWRAGSGGLTTVLDVKIKMYPHARGQQSRLR